MEHQLMLSLYLLFVSLLSGAIAFFGASIGRRVERQMWKNVLLAFFFILSSLLCLDGYERANFLIAGYIENQSISRDMFNELLSTIGLWKFVFPAILAGFGISRLNEIIKSYVEPAKL